ncbi:MAG TPA: hypothetical protein VMV07_07850 [Streptosporangiaceae bacterium]|nr:hypothetical protein [Streptosporangiaceae bacterium]
MPHVTPLRAEDPDRVGRHRLTGRISGMPGGGTFYLATAADGTEVALRLLHGRWTHDAAARDRFTAEAASATRVPPFCAARILDAGAEHGYAYLVSEYVAGKSLLEAVSDDGKFGGAQLEALAVGSATGLAAVHQTGLVHGNFGPEHVIMSAGGPRIIEFGVTPPYGPATPSADMLAWAQTMVFASMGRPPATLADLDVLPESLRRAVADCLVGDPALRPAAKSVVLGLLGDAEPAAGALAEGSRRAAQAAQGVQGSQQARAGRSGSGSRSGPGSRPARQSGQRRADGAVRQQRREHGRPDPERAGGGPGGAGHATHDHSAGRRRARSGRRSGVLPIAAAVVVVAAVAVVIVHVMQNGSGPGAAHANTAQSSTSPVSSTVSNAPPATPAVVPSAFAGSWSGQAKQLNPTDVFDVKLSIPMSITAGSTAGSIQYSSASFTCAGDLSLRSLGHSTLTLSQGIVTGQSTCANGMVTLSTGAGGVLRFSFRGKTGPTASGTLTRS